MYVEKKIRVHGELSKIIYSNQLQNFCNFLCCKTFCIGMYILYYTLSIIMYI